MPNLLKKLEKWLQKNLLGTAPLGVTADPITDRIVSESESAPESIAQSAPQTETPFSIEERIKQYRADQVAQLRMSDEALHQVKRLDIFSELAEAAQEEFGENADHVNVMEYLNNITKGISRYIPAPPSQAAITLHDMQYERVKAEVYLEAAARRATENPYVAQEKSWCTDPVLKEMRSQKSKEMLAAHNAKTAAPYAGLTPEELKEALQARDDANNASVYAKYNAMRIVEFGEVARLDETHTYTDSLDNDAPIDNPDQVITDDE